MNWQKLNSSEQLEAIKNSSQDPSVSGILIFKHSTRCGTSAMALNRVERNWNIDEAKLPTYFLDLLEYRDLSAAIATMFDVRHESPQVLVVKDGACIYSASHNSITVEGIASSLK